MQEKYIVRIKVWMFVALISIGIYANIGGQSGSVNPYNKYMSGAAGVNLYSGDAYFSIPLGAGPVLNYSSNIFVNAHGDNKDAPTSWTGLGWRLGVGAITRDHKGTKSPLDDEFYWLSPTGVTRVIKRHSYHGVRYKYYEIDDWYTETPNEHDMTKEHFVRQGVTGGINLGLKHRLGAYGVTYETYVHIPEDGEYSIEMFSGLETNGHTSRLTFYKSNSNKIIIQSNGGSKSASVTLTTGYYKIKHLYMRGSIKSNLVEPDYFIKIGKRGATVSQAWTVLQGTAVFTKSPDARNEHTYYIENDPYTKITASYAPEHPDFDEQISGWEVLTSSGHRLQYGFYNNPIWVTTSRGGGALGAFGGSFIGPGGTFVGGYAGAEGGDYLAGKFAGWLADKIGLKDANSE